MTVVPVIVCGNDRCPRCLGWHPVEFDCAARPNLAFPSVAAPYTPNVAALTDRIALLEGALRPFAALISCVNDCDGDDEAPSWSPFIPIKAYRQAAQALAEGGQPHD